MWHLFTRCFFPQCFRSHSQHATRAWCVHYGELIAPDLSGTLETLPVCIFPSVLIHWLPANSNSMENVIFAGMKMYTLFNGWNAHGIGCVSSCHGPCYWDQGLEGSQLVREVLWMTINKQKKETNGNGWDSFQTGLWHERCMFWTMQAYILVDCGEDNVCVPDLRLSAAP